MLVHFLLNSPVSKLAAEGEGLGVDVRGAGLDVGMSVGDTTGLGLGLGVVVVVHPALRHIETATNVIIPNVSDFIFIRGKMEDLILYSTKFTVGYRHYTGYNVRLLLAQQYQTL